MTKTKMMIIAIALFAVAASALYWFFLRPNSERPTDATIQVGGAQYHVEFADSLTDQARGLAGRSSLKSDFGMLFRFPSKRVPTFVMQGMKFPLDMVWIAENRVVEISANLPPDTGLMPKYYQPQSEIDMVLEINAGAAARDGVKIGDSVNVVSQMLR